MVWLKGNLHTHVGEGMSLTEALERYAELGYDFLSISDHMKLTLARHRRLLLIPGIEWNSFAGEHMGVYSFHQAVLRRCLKSGEQLGLLRYLGKQPALVVLNHPNWQEPEHYSRKQLMARTSAIGMEIYNGVIERLEGCALATDKWDYLLSRGRRLFGFASDDAHSLADIGRGWIVVRAASRTPAAVYDAILRGDFYSSTGVTIRSIRRQKARFIVDTADADEIWAIGSKGVCLARVSARRMEFKPAGYGGSYVRFTVFGRGAAMAWTQPFHLDGSGESGPKSAFITRWWLSRIDMHRLSDAPSVNLRMPMEWTPAEGKDGFVSVHHRYGNKDGVVYLANRFMIHQAGDWTVFLGHDGGAKVFVDGEQVLYQPLRINPCIADRSPVTVRLTRGTHEIVIALDTDNGMGQGIYFRFMSPREKGKISRAVVFPKRLAR